MTIWLVFCRFANKMLTIHRSTTGKILNHSLFFSNTYRTQISRCHVWMFTESMWCSDPKMAALPSTFQPLQWIAPYFVNNPCISYLNILKFSCSPSGLRFYCICFFRIQYRFKFSPRLYTLIYYYVFLMKIIVYFLYPKISCVGI